MCAAVDAVAASSANAASVDNMKTILSEARFLFTGESRVPAFPPGVRARLMPCLIENRKTRQDCDVVFKATDGLEIWAHRFVLAASYSGCQVLFTAATEKLRRDKEPEQPEWIPPIRVVVSDQSSDMVELLVDSAYNAPMDEHIGFHNVSRVLELAEKQNITILRRHCITMLERNIDPHTCIWIYQLAVTKGHHSLAANAFACLVRNFHEIWQSNADFHSLTPDEMRAVLADNRLHALSEVEDTFRAVLKWISADAADRKKYLAQFLPLVRFSQFTIRDWEKVIADPEVQTDGDSLEVLSVIYQTLSRPSMLVDACTSVDLSLKTWLKPRVPKGIVFLFGGRTWFGSHNEMRTYNCRTGTWRFLGKQPTAARAKHGVAVLNSCIYFVGGCFSLVGFRSVVCFDVNRNQWSQKASMDFARAEVSVAIHKGLIYAIGGRDHITVTDTVERYDPKSNRWRQVASMNAARCGAGAAVARGRIYIVGGEDGSLQGLDTVERYDPSADTWTRVLTMLSPRWCPQVVAYGELIYVFGGYHDVLWLKSMELLDLRRGLSTDLPSMTHGKHSFPAFQLEGYIYAIEGTIGSPGTKPTAYVERFDIQRGKWDTVDDLGIDCFGATACVVYDVQQPEMWL